jgi:hypothetical protein
MKCRGRRLSPSRLEETTHRSSPACDRSDGVGGSPGRKNDAITLQVLKPCREVSRALYRNHACNLPASFGDCDATTLLHLAEDFAQLGLRFVDGIRAGHRPAVSLTWSSWSSCRCSACVRRASCVRWRRRTSRTVSSPVYRAQEANGVDSVRGSFILSDAPVPSFRSRRRCCRRGHVAGRANGVGLAAHTAGVGCDGGAGR